MLYAKTHMRDFTQQAELMNIGSFHKKIHFTINRHM